MTHFHFRKCLGYIGCRFHLSLTLLDFRKIKKGWPSFWIWNFLYRSSYLLQVLKKTKTFHNFIEMNSIFLFRIDEVYESWNLMSTRIAVRASSLSSFNSLEWLETEISLNWELGRFWMINGELQRIYFNREIYKKIVWKFMKGR